MVPGDRTLPSVSCRGKLEMMRSRMAKMENRIAELEAAKRTAATSSSTDPTLLQSQTPMAQKVRSQPGEDVKKPEGPMSFRYKGLTLTPGGFLEGTMLVRTRNENADIANNYSAIPLNGSPNAKTERIPRNRAQLRVLAARPRHVREDRSYRICRNRFSRRSTDCQLR